jgi:tetratricopeptide (TPR) repeat protein
MKWNFLQNLFGKTKIDGSEAGKQEYERDEPTSDTKVLLERAKNKTKSKNYQSALDDINNILSIEPNNISAYMERSTVRRKLKDEIGAAEDFEYAGVLLKKLDKGLKAYQKGLDKYNASDFKEAIKYFSDAISSNVDTSGAYYYRGLSKRYNGDYRAALPDFNKAIEIKPDYTEAYFDRAKIKYHKLDDIDGALQDFNQAILLNPKDADLYVSRAILKNSINDDEGAMRDYNNAIELNPEDGETYFSRALLHMDVENYLESIKDFDIVIKIGLSEDDSVSMFDAYSMRGASKLLSRNYEEAIKDFDKAIELEPENGKTFFDRGEAYLLLGKNDQAAEDKFMALKLGYEEVD